MNYYFVVYNVFNKEISAFISSYVFDNFYEIFNRMKAGLKNGDIILEIENKCGGDIKGYNNVLQCQEIIKNLCS